MRAWPVRKLYDGRSPGPRFFDTGRFDRALASGEDQPGGALTRLEARDGSRRAGPGATTIGSRALHERRIFRAEQVFEPPADVAGQRRAAAAGGDGDLQLTAAKHRGHDEVAVVAP